MLLSLLLVLFSTLHCSLSDDSSPKPSCPANFQLSSDNRCYYLMPNPDKSGFPQSYAQQLFICRDNYEGDLPSITTEEALHYLKEEAGIQFFRDIIAGLNNAVFYIGLECRKDVWSWSDGRVFHASLAYYHLPEEYDPTSCGDNENLRFVYSSTGNWTPWSEASFPQYILCAIDSSPYQDDTIGIIILCAIVACMLILVALLVFCICRARKRRREANESLAAKVAKTKSVDGEERYRIETIIKDDWEISRSFVAVEWDSKLGNGAFGTVFLGRLSARRLPSKPAQSFVQVVALERNGDRVAVKMLIESADRLADLAFRAEIELMKNLGIHERLVNMLGCVTDSAPTMLIVEYCNKGDLLRHMKKCREYMLTLDPLSKSIDFDQIITEKQQFMFADQIACGLEYLANRGYVHRDIAARNILVDQNDTAKIGDFGLCRKLEESDGLYLTRGGRLPIKWMAPEALRNYQMSTASDVWSYGVLLFEIVTLGGSPYAGWALAEILPRLEAGERIPRPDSCHDLLYKLMGACWMQRPAQRPTFSLLRTQLEPELDKMHESSNYIQLDSEQHYYQIGTEDDESVPEEVFLRHFVNTQALNTDIQPHQEVDIAELSPDGYQVPLSSPASAASRVLPDQQRNSTEDGYQIPKRAETLSTVSINKHNHPK